MWLFDGKLEEACRTLAEANDQVLQAAGLAGQMRLNALQKRCKGEKPTASLVPTETTWERGNQLVEAVINDMHRGENSGQWPLSTYGPFQCRSSYPTFRDHSFEEIRYLYYEARKSGDFPKFQENWGNLFKEALENIRALQTPSKAALEILQRMYEKPPSTFPTTCFR